MSERSERDLGVLSRWELIAAAVLIVILSAVYWTHPSRKTETREVATFFYRPLLTSGLSLDGEHIIRHLESGTFTDWTYLNARRAYTHWHRRAVAPDAFDNLMEAWQSGLWAAPDISDLQLAVDALDRRWIERRPAGSTNTLQTPYLLAEAGWAWRVPNGSFEKQPSDDLQNLLVGKAEGTPMLFLDPPPETGTETLGSTLILDITSDSVTTKHMPVVLYWSTSQLGISSYRRIVGDGWKSVGVTPDGRDIVRLDFPLDDEPGWIHESAKVGQLRFDFNGASDRIEIWGLGGEESEYFNKLAAEVNPLPQQLEE